MKQAVEVLLPMWTDIATDDALELLGPGTVDSRVRAFAIKQLARADDDVSYFTASSGTTFNLSSFTGAPPLPPPTRPSSKVRGHDRPGTRPSFSTGSIRCANDGQWPRGLLGSSWRDEPCARDAPALVLDGGDREQGDVETLWTCCV